MDAVGGFRRWNRALVGVAIVFGVSTLTVSGCILIVKHDPDSFGDHCRFDGDDGTSCGECIAAQCQSLVDKCCDPASGCSSLDNLDSCSRDGDALACAFVEVNDASQADRDLGGCVKTRCASSCASLVSTSSSGSSAQSSSSGGPSGNCYTVDQLFCTCDPTTGGDGKPCDDTALPNSYCCAEYDYPASGTTCTCHGLRCKAYNNSGSWSCECTSDSSDGPLTECGHEYGAYCCLQFEGCTCSDTPCDTGTEVDSCTASVIECPSSSQLTSSCTL